MSSYETIRIDIHNLRELPPLAESSRDLLGAINDPDISLKRLCEILETEPSVSARLLGLANSAYFGYRGNVHSIRQAVIRVLGLKLAKSLALSILISDALDTRQCPNFSGQRYWFTAVTTAILAKQFCSATPDRKTTDPSLAYTAGLLHNIGLLALVHKFPDRMARVFEESVETARPVSAILRNLYSLDQHQAGGWLAGRWQFPEAIRVSIREHGNPDYAGRYMSLVALARTASRFSSQFYQDKDISRAIQEASAILNISGSKAEKIFEYLYSRLEGFNSLAKLLNGNRP